MKQAFLKTISILSSCFLILCLLAAHSSFANSFEDVLSAETRELKEKLQWISDNERFDYPEDKAFFHKKISELHKALTTISDSERIHPEEKAYVSYQITKLTNVLNRISDNERIYPGEKAYVHEKFDKLTQVLGFISDNEKYLDGLDLKTQELAQVLSFVIIHDNERDVHIKGRDLTQVLGFISDNEKYLEDDYALKAHGFTQFLGFLHSDDGRGMEDLVEELIEVLSWISDNERVDYTEKLSVQKKIQALTQVLGIIIHDNERVAEDGSPL